MSKELYLNSLDAVREVIDRLPQDVRICRIYDGHRDGKDMICIQILRHPEMTPDRIMREDDCFTWMEKDYDAKGMTVTVGWCGGEEEDDESAV